MIAWGAPSFQELVVILVIVLIVFGAKRLPELARALGQSMNEFRKAKEEFEKELHKPTPAAAAAPAPTTHSAEEQRVPVLQSPSQTIPASVRQSTAADSSAPDFNRSPENRQS
ncbi:MAG: twin-arginine translocase TatA/TatE family subunit [Verrucomicrobia bacterium]|nr:MAG: twin-arginine translocase TatA/TatE family subunit [Verrucomicrobiota bacterium]